MYPRPMWKFLWKLRSESSPRDSNTDTSQTEWKCIRVIKINWKFEYQRQDQLIHTLQVMMHAVRAFILQVIIGHGAPAPLFCNKDPFTIKYLPFLKEIFPNSKHIMMLRDGRSTVHSVITRGVTISGWDLEDPLQCMKMVMFSPNYYYYYYYFYYYYNYYYYYYYY